MGSNTSTLQFVWIRIACLVCVVVVKRLMPPTLIDGVSDLAESVCGRERSSER